MSAESYNKKQMAGSYPWVQQTDGGFTWDQIELLAKFWQGHHELSADGYVGPNTQQTLNAILAPKIVDPTREWEPWDGPLERQPHNRTEVYQMFGSPGTVTMDQNWFNKNVSEVHGQTAWAGVPRDLYVKAHNDMEPYAREGFRRVSLSSHYKIVKVGSHNFRHIRFDPDEELSFHSWALALDINSDDNMPHDFGTHRDKPFPWTSGWKKIWPNGVDEPFVRAMMSVGFTWGGWWSPWTDPMHFQFVGKRSV